mmetsp:Transcript_71508/g.190716  ORF Transcript_71508/g.190716 Transcript_71508/m.190716 type:complete len:615 (+) Transcript_71508:559-2403(+)
MVQLPSRPTLQISEVWPASTVHEPVERTSDESAQGVGRTKGERRMLEHILGTLAASGSVLIPTATAGRVVDVLLLLEAAWQKQKAALSRYPICLVDPVGDMIVEILKTRMEWSSGENQTLFEERVFEDSGVFNPFVLPSVEFFCDAEDMFARHPVHRPKVVFATDAHLEDGDSRILFSKLASGPKNLVLFGLNQRSPDSLASKLLHDKIVSRVTTGAYEVKICSRVSLPEDELRAYYMSRKKSDLEEATRNRKARAPEQGPQPAADIDEDVEDGLTVFSTPQAHQSCRTLKWTEQRRERDEYGDRLVEKVLLHAISGPFLLAQDLARWRAASDQDPDALVAEAKRLRLVAASVAADGDSSDSEVIAEKDEDIGWRRDLLIRYGEPKKNQEEVQSVPVVCKIRYVDASGNHDSTQLSGLLAMTRPHNLVLFGNEMAAALLRTQLDKSMILGCQHVAVLTAKEPWSPAWPLAQLMCPGKVSDSLLTPLKWRKVGERGYAVAMLAEASFSSAAQSEDPVAVLDCRAPPIRQLPRACVFVKDSPLGASDLPQFLPADGKQPTFLTATAVSMRDPADSASIILSRQSQLRSAVRMTLSGGMSERFYDVRQRLHSGFVFV